MPEFDFLKDAEKAFNRLTGKKPPKQGKGQKSKDRNPKAKNSKEDSPKDGSNASQKFPKQNPHAKRGKLFGGAASGKSAPGKENGLEASALYLEARRFKAKRSYSQNFLIDAVVLSRMVARLKNNNRPEPSALVKISDEEAANSKPQAKPQELKLLPLPPVLEIGPGLGFLTQLLIQEYPDVTAVELDPDMVGYMRKKFLGVPNLTLVQQDILRFDFDAYPPETFQLVGNLPYNITSPILFKLLGELNEPNHPLRKRIQQALFMVQREVGERLTALPGTKAYNHLSIAIQYWYQTAMAVSVKPKSFYPAPKVDSVVVEFIPRPEPLCPVDDLDVFSRFIRMAFSQKRKTLRNALVNAQLGDAAFVDSLLQEAEIDPSHRAETISVERFGNLANVYHRRTR